MSCSVPSKQPPGGKKEKPKRYSELRYLKFTCIMQKGITKVEGSCSNLSLNFNRNRFAISKVIRLFTCYCILPSARWFEYMHVKIAKASNAVKYKRGVSLQECQGPAVAK